MKETRTTAAMAAAFGTLPKAEFSPVEAYEKLVRNEVEQVTLENAAGRIAATGIVPYPPGIPLLMPGENAGAADGPLLAYLRALESFDRSFPGFTHDTHGIESDGGCIGCWCSSEDVVAGGIRCRAPYNCCHTYATIRAMSGLNSPRIAQQFGHRNHRSPSY